MPVPTPKKVLGKKRKRESYRFQIERLRKTQNNARFFSYFTISTVSPEERAREIKRSKLGITTDMGPREFSNQMRESEDEREESRKENSKDSRIMVNLGGKDSHNRFNQIYQGKQLN